MTISDHEPGICDGRSTKLHDHWYHSTVTPQRASYNGITSASKLMKRVRLLRPLHTQSELPMSAAVLSPLEGKTG